MGILDKIGAFLKNKESGVSFKNDVSVDTHSTRTAGNGQTGGVKTKHGDIYIDNSTTNNYSISLDKSVYDLPQAKKQELARIFLEAFRAGEVNFVKKEATQDLKEYKTFEKAPDFTRVEEYFANKIPPDDLRLLQTGLLVREMCFDRIKKEQAMKIKERAAKDRRSRNIINLASAGYFEDYIKPIFDSNEYEKAMLEYREIVDYMPEIVFVNNNMSVSDIVMRVEEKLALKKRYHLEVSQIIINGIGRQCAQNISDAVKELKEEHAEFGFSEETQETKDLVRKKVIIKIEIDHSPPYTPLA